MIDSNTANHPFLTPAKSAAQAAPGRTGAAAQAHLYLLRARLMIFLYRNPLDNYEQIMDVIDNTESAGEIQLLLDYVLARRLIKRDMRWINGPETVCG